MQEISEWHVYDEMSEIFRRVHEAVPGLPDSEVVALVTEEQERQGWPGLLKVPDSTEG